MVSLRCCVCRLVVSLGCFMPPVVLAQDAEPPDVVVTRQGGYVEKLDPNVDYKDRLQRFAPREPAESLRGFRLIPGFQIDLVAAEPMVIDAVDLAFDENGRLFVAEMIPYAEGGTSQFGSPRGRVSMLEDTDGDGRFDRSTVYVDRLVWPTGLACFDGGVFIAAAPDLLYCKDTDGDGGADHREVVLTGFELTNPNALPGSLRWGLDNRLHGMTSTAGGKLSAKRWERVSGSDVPAVQARGRDFSIDPRSGELRLESGGGQFGMAVDDWGRKFESSNSSPCDMVMYEDRYIARNPYLAAPSPKVNVWKSGSAIFRTSPLEPWRVIRTEMRIGGSFSGPVEGGGTAAGYFTAACGLTIYRGDAWPESYRGNGFVCEGAGNLVARMRFEPDGVGFAALRTEQGRDFLTSDEVWFRPIQCANGPDGNLYFSDMYREVFEHPDAVPPSVKKYLDITTGNDRGRIYRIAAEGHQPGALPRLGEMSTAELVELLAHANAWHRETAARLLFQRQDKDAVEPLVQLADNSPSPLGRMHALHVLDGMAALTPDILLPRLADAHPRVREHAVRLSEGVLADSPAVRETLYRMVDDADLRVRYQLAFTLGEIPGIAASEALASIVRRDAEDRWIQLAVLSSCLGRAGELFTLLAQDTHWRKDKASLAVMESLAEQVGLQEHADQVAEVLAALESLGADESALAQAVVKGLSKGLAASKSPLLAKLSNTDDSRAGSLLQEMIESSRKKALDEDLPVATRVAAIRSLATASYDVAADVLLDLLEPWEPQEVQAAAVQTLGRFSSEAVADALVRGWRGFSPAVRSAAAESLFARPDRLHVLLDAIEAGKIQPSHLDPARVQYLLNYPDSQIRAAAEQVLGGVKLARRDDIVQAYQDALDRKGDRSRGKAVFKQECSSCHKLEGVGFDLGLPLQSIRNRGREGILLNVLDPNREVNPAYANYIAVTIDGISVSGMVSAETATSITLTRGQDQSDTVLRKDVDQMVNTGLSIMPEGLEKQIDKQAMADLIEYLMGL